MFRSEPHKVSAPEELRVGGIYWVRGCGPMRITELPDPPGPYLSDEAFKRRKITITMQKPRGTTYWAGYGDLLPTDAKMLADYLVSYKSAFSKLDEDRMEEIQAVEAWQQELAAAEAAAKKDV